MAKISAPRALWLSQGFPGFTGVPSAQYVVGRDTSPLAIQVTVANAAAMAVDLTARGSWVTERKTAAGYSVTSSADTSRLNAILSVCAVGLKITTFSDTVNLASAVAKLTTNATEPYLSGTIGGVPFRQSLKRGISHYVKRLDASQAVAADEILTTLDQGYVVLPMPIRVNLMTDALSLVSDAAVALGADATATLELVGMLVPADADASWQSFYAGASCANAGSDNAPLSSVEDLSQVRGLNTSFATSVVKL